MVALYGTDKGKEKRMLGKKYKIAAQDRKDILMGAEVEPQGRFVSDRITVTAAICTRAGQMRKDGFQAVDGGLPRVVSRMHPATMWITWVRQSPRHSQP